MRDFRLFAIVDDEQTSELERRGIHDDAGYRRVREALSRQYDLGCARARTSRSGTSTCAATAR